MTKNDSPLDPSSKMTVSSANSFTAPSIRISASSGTSSASKIRTRLKNSGFKPMSPSHFLEQVPEPFFLGAEIGGGNVVRRNLDPDALGDFETVRLESDEFAGVVRQQPHPTDSELGEDLSADPVLPLIR